MASLPIQQIVYDQINHLIGLQDSEDGREDVKIYLATLALEKKENIA